LNRSSKVNEKKEGKAVEKQSILLFWQSVQIILKAARTLQSDCELKSQTLERLDESAKTLQASITDDKQKAADDIKEQRATLL